jgi:hypothetical protein
VEALDDLWHEAPRRTIHRFVAPSGDPLKGQAPALAFAPNYAGFSELGR